MVPVTILSGPIRSGKTTKLAAWAQGRDDVRGVLSPDGPGGRRFFDLTTGKSVPMENPGPGEKEIAVGRFRFRAAAFSWANARVIDAASDTRATLVIDEVGPLELGGGGLVPGLQAALDRAHGRLVLVVRELLVNDVRRAFGIDHVDVTPDIGWWQHGHSARSAPYSADSAPAANSSAAVPTRIAAPTVTIWSARAAKGR